MVLITTLFPDCIVTMNPHSVKTYNLKTTHYIIIPIALIQKQTLFPCGYLT